MNNICFFEEDVKIYLLKRNYARKCIEAILKNNKKEIGIINFIFCSDSYLYKMNKEFLKHNTLTDIITFDYSEGTTISGDIFISIDRVKENAKLFHVKQLDELHRVMVHGILHMLGFSDKSEKEEQEMRSQENKVLSTYFV